MKIQKGFLSPPEPKSPQTKSRRPWQRAIQALLHHRLAQIGFAGILFISAFTLLSPLISPYDPLEMDYARILLPPNGEHWFGTDDLGRDLLSRILWGGRETIKAGYLAVLIGLSGGVVIGLFSGYVGGRLDDLIQRIVEILMAFPGILLLLSIIAALGPNLTTVIIAIGVSSIPSYSRLLRGSVISAPEPRIYNRCPSDRGQRWAYHVQAPSAQYCRPHSGLRHTGPGRGNHAYLGPELPRAGRPATLSGMGRHA